MGKEQSMALRGIAITMMVMYHLFYVATAHGYEVVTYLNFGEVPLLERLSEIAYPVSLFVMITGYGLAVAHQKRTMGRAAGNVNIGGGNSLGRKTWKLFFRLWMVYLLVIPIGYCAQPERYPGTWDTLIINLLNIQTTYNVSEWFLLPYLLMVAVSPLLLKFIFRFNSFWAIALSLLATAIYLLIYQGHMEELRSYVGAFGAKMFLTLSFFLPFTLGTLAFKHSLPEYVRDKLGKIGTLAKPVAVLLLILLIVFRCFVHNQSLQPFAVFVLFIMFPSLNLSRKSMQILCFLGKHSVVIWFIHTWFSQNLFAAQIYGLHYPILIFAAVMALSVLTSLLIEFVCQRLRI